MLLGCLLAVSVLIAAGLCLVTGSFVGLARLWLLPVSFVGAFVVLVGLAFGFLWLMCKLVDQSKPQEQDSKFYRGLMHLYVDAIITVARINVKTSGLEQTPKSGRFLLVSNHIDNIDPAFLLTYFRKSQLAFISKREVQNFFLVGELMHKILCQPINRENDREALKTILQCIKMIKEDEASIAVFPEGRITGDELMHSFRSGVFKIALKTQVPIVVCTLYGTQHVLKNAMRLKPSEVDFHLVKVIYPEDYAGMTATEIGNMAYELMAQDLGPDKVWQKPENMEETE